MNTTPTSLPPVPCNEPQRMLTVPEIAAPLPPLTQLFHHCRLDVRAVRRTSFTEFFITAMVLDAPDGEVAADEALGAVADVLTEQRIQPMAEKLYGLSALRATVLRRREEIYRHHELDVRMPVTWIEGKPVGACAFVGVQLWGFVPHVRGVEVTPVGTPGHGRARLMHGPNFRLLHLPCVRGTVHHGRLADTSAMQAEWMFHHAGAALEAHGFSYRHVVRTWIYMAKLLSWYDDFNWVRTACYKPFGFGGQGGLPFPASTGIQCRSDDEACMMDVLAVKMLDDATPSIATAIQRSPRQDQSFNYGSAFSRGMALNIEGRRTVHISGTASINAAGESIHLGDAELQSVETLLCIAAILEEQGGSLQHITSATVFCKDLAAYGAWQRVSRLLQVPDFPKVCVVADVCRHDLLVEMEAVAVI